MDSMSNLTTQTTTPRKASVLNKLGMPETLRSATVSSTKAKPPTTLNSPSLLERMQLSHSTLAQYDLSKHGGDSHISDSGSATGCSPTVHSVTRPMRRKSRLSQATEPTSDNGNGGTDPKPSLLDRLEGVNNLEAYHESFEAPEDMLRIKGSAATATQRTPKAPSFPSGSRFRRGPGNRTLMDRMRRNEAKDLGLSRSD